MQDFQGLSRLEQYAFPGAKNRYPEPPMLANTDTLWMMTRDGDWITGIFIPGAENNDICVIYFYSNRDNLRGAEAVIHSFRKLGVAVLCFDYRGFGASTGRPSERSFHMDAEFAFDWLSNRHADLKPVVAGRCVGGAVAAFLATVRDVERLMLFSAPTNMIEIVRDIFAPDDVIIEEALPFRFDTLSYITRVTCPILIVHGDEDDVIPYEMSLELEAAAQSPVTRYSIAGAGHHNLFTHGGETLWRHIGEFLAPNQLSPPY